MRCLSCKYDLSNLTPTEEVYRCPECGRAFDPDDPVSYEGQRVWKFFPMFLRLSAGWLLGVMIVTVVMNRLFWGTENFLAAAALVAIVTFIFVFPIFLLVALATMGRVRGRSRPID